MFFWKDALKMTPMPASEKKWLWSPRLSSASTRIVKDLNVKEHRTKNKDKPCQNIKH
jgi:hypothetical protein